MIDSRVKRQLDRQRIEPRGLESFRQQLPQIHEYSTGSVVQIDTCSSGRYHFKYITVPAPIKLYTLRILATNYAVGYPGSVTTIGAALYKPTSPVPSDNADMSGSATGNGPQLELIEESPTIYSADSYDSTGGTATADGGVTSGGPPTVPGGLPSTWGVFYFTNEPLLLPGNDYYLGFSTYGGAGTFGFWTDNANGSVLNSNGWYSSSGAVPSTNAFLKDIKPSERGLPTPACILQSKHGCKRSGYRIS